MDTKAKNSYNVLLVNSHQGTYQTLKKLLSEIKGNTFQIDWITNYNEAIKAIHHHQHDLAFIDYQLDNKHTGIDLLTEVSTDNNSMPFILLTGEANHAIDQEAMRLGVADLLTQDQLNKTFLERSIRHSIERQRLINQVNQLAHYDALTDLPNRLSFDKALKRAVASAVRYDRTSALLIIDLDDFKQINQNYGRDLGDLTLQEISARLRASLRDSDYVARIDSNRFGVILNEINDLHDTGIVAKNIAEKISEPLSFSQKGAKVTASIGIVSFPNQNKTGTGLLSCAEDALRRCKELPQNRYQFYRRELQQENQQQLSIDSLLPLCIVNDELYLTFQPIMDLKENKIIGMETLIRWYCRQINQDMPLDEFIPIAEENGFIEKIDKWVIKNTLKQLVKWDKHGYQGFVTVNISPQHLFKAQFITFLLECEKEYGDYFKQLKIETHEKTLTKKILTIKESVSKLDELDIELYIDRFGGDYCSLKQINDLMIGTIKIDKCLIKKIDTHEGCRIIKAIIAMSEPLDLKVIAEGIETDQQRKSLIEWGCLQGQGYLYSQPLITSRMTQYLKSHKNINGSDE